MRYVILPHGLFFTSALLEQGQVVSGETIDGYKFEVADGVEIVKHKELVIRRPAMPQDVMRVPNHIRGGKRDVLRWARRTHDRVFHKL